MGLAALLGRPHRGPPIAPVERRATSTTPSAHGQLAREVWRDRELSDRLDREADELRARFNEAFWNESGGYYVLALDGEKRQVDSLLEHGSPALERDRADDRVDKVVDA